MEEQTLVKHIASGGIYLVIGKARSKENPNIMQYVYAQQRETTLDGTDIILPKGTLWTREASDFESKFKPVVTSKTK